MFTFSKRTSATVIRQHTAKGSFIIEGAIGTLILIPSIILTILAAIETSQAFAIAQAMNEGAYLAAKGLANYYKTNPEVISCCKCH